MSTVLRILAVTGLVFLLSLDARADRMAEITRIHVEAIGGHARVLGLSSLRMRGEVTAGTQQFEVTLTAARPARLRAETVIGARVIIQASNGTTPPWQLERGGPKEAPVALSPEAAQRFQADAEFDDPLVRAHLGLAAVEFAGEATMDGRKFLRVLVPRKLTENVVVFVDAQTYLIAMRVQEVPRGERRVELRTRYASYRPVEGVLVPHEVELFEDGRLTQRAQFWRIEGNPPLDAEHFLPPIPDAR